MSLIGMAFMVIGLFFLLVAAIGMIRLPDVFTRSHAVGLTDSVGALFLLTGLALYQGFNANMVRVLIVLALLYLLNPVITHATVRAALRSGVETLEQGEPMTYSFELVLLALVLITAGGAILVKNLISAAFILGSYSFFLALVWAWVGAVDLAFVESVVGAGLATVFFLLTLFQIAPKDIVIRRTPPPLAALLSLPPLGLLLIVCGRRTFRHLVTPASPASTHISPVLSRKQPEGYADAQCRDLDHHGLPRL